MDNHRIAARMGTALPSLVRWGLSPDADLVYRTLVSLDTAREGQLAQELGMAHERVREAMQELANAGAIRRVTAASRRTATAAGRAVWAARQPNQVVRHLHGHRTRPIGPAVGSDPVATPPAAHAIPMTAAPPGLVTAAALAGHPTCAPTVNHPGPGHATVNQVATNPAGPGHAARSGHPDPAGPGGPADGFRWIPHQVACQPAEALAEAGRPEEAFSLTPRERAIIELLAQGHTDETAARELELSRRTVGYALGGLMSRLGVDNRFQLGLALGAMRAAAPAPRGKTRARMVTPPPTAAN